MRISIKYFQIFIIVTYLKFEVYPHHCLMPAREIRKKFWSILKDRSLSIWTVWKIKNWRELLLFTTVFLCNGYKMFKRLLKTRYLFLYQFYWPCKCDTSLFTVLSWSILKGMLGHFTIHFTKIYHFNEQQLSSVNSILFLLCQDSWKYHDQN